MADYAVSVTGGLQPAVPYHECMLLIFTRRRSLVIAELRTYDSIHSAIFRLQHKQHDKGKLSGWCGRTAAGLDNKGYLDSLPTPLPCDATSLANVSPAMLSIGASGILGAPKAKSSAPQVSSEFVDLFSAAEQERLRLSGLCFAQCHL
ncbi:unnamed protein product [Phytophthora fragariaefolia]|uniref:Unnamed protein product n=1 Tax=Phytophthora fragariaefolia TaxID=1490495 RepID=A0A9W7D4M0_9STRA|nr:unnamed protein product [Phytophthora fragariaefolia]